MILLTFRHSMPFRGYFLTTSVLSYIAIMWMMTSISTPIVNGAIVPDAAIQGYTPQQALIWYEAIGERGRSIYFRIFLLDLFILIPSYVLWLGSQIAAETSPIAAGGVRAAWWSYLPLAAGVFDAIESTTHGCAVTGSWRPTVEHLVIANAATQFKFATLILSCLLAFYYTTILNRTRRHAE